MKDNVTWDELFMSMVFLIASKSKDNNTHIGAVIVDDDNIVRSLGYNGFPRDIDDTKPERQEKPLKYFWMTHAELNAILNSRTNLSGCRMYTNGTPCAECAKAIIQAGIKEVIVYKKWDADNNPKWRESCSISVDMFVEKGINLRFYDGGILNIQGWRSGKVYPLKERNI